MTGTRRDWITDLGIGTVGLAAAVLTFTTLTDLAVAVGITGALLGVPLAWLVPITVDAAGVVAARVWLKQLGPAAAVEFARRLAMTCISLSVLGNGGEHGMSAYHVTAPWWVVVAVSAVPPAMLGAVVHLGHLRSRTTHTGGETASHVVDDDASTDLVPEQVQVVAGPGLDPVGPPSEVPASEQQRTDQTTPKTADPDPLLDTAIRWAATYPGPISQRAVRAEFRVGADRARVLHEAITQGV